MSYFPDDVVEHILSFIETHRDRNAMSAVCKTWYRVERLSRKSAFIGNCYAIRPETVAARFPGLRSLTVKGKPHFANFNMVPYGWGGFAGPWIEAVVRGCPCLEELRMKRMVVSDENLELLARSFPNFKSLILNNCEGFSTNGLAAIATHCRYLRELDLQENWIEDHGPQWLSCFPDTCTSIVSLNFAWLDGDVNAGTLERLVARSPNLRSLRLGSRVSVETLSRILIRSPNLVDLGTGSFNLPFLRFSSGAFHRLVDAFSKCKSLRSLSGFWHASPNCFLTMHTVYSNLTTLNLIYAATIQSADLIKIISVCMSLQRLWVLDIIGDKGLGVVGSTCKDLRELRVFPSQFMNGSVSAATEEGLVSVSSGCPKLSTLLYFCHQMTNAALITVAKNCPDLQSFRLCVLTRKKPDPVTHQPLDEGFGAIVQSCKNLRRLSLSGLLTDRVFLYIGMYAESLEMLSVSFAGESDMGMMYVLNGCKSLKKMVIRECPFGDAALLSNVGKYETMRSLWMSSCDVTLAGSRSLAAKMPGLNVEVVAGRNGIDPVTDKVRHIYVYRSVAGPRDDAPALVLKL